MDAGYTQLECSKIITSKRRDEESKQEIYGKDRPRTKVVSQGKVFTYEKLEIITNKKTKSGNARGSKMSLGEQEISTPRILRRLLQVT